MRQRLLILMIGAMVSWPASATDPPCKPNNKTCMDWVQSQVANTNTGVSNLVSPSQSTAKDFLTRLAASLLVPMSGNGARPLAFDYNLPGKQGVKLQVVLAKPELNGHLTQRLAGNAPRSRR